MTHNVWHIGSSTYENQFSDAKDIKPTEDLKAYLNVYQDAVKIFIAQIKSANPNALIVLNCARAASDEFDGTSTTKDKYKLAHFNAAWQALDQAFIKIVPDCKTINVDPTKIVGWDQHPWGAGYVHYILPFYAEFLSKLDALVDARKPRSMHRLWRRLTGR